jgi:endonuclease/exonuclease/phosphatase family metal-dependent hydrolase
MALTIISVCGWNASNDRERRTEQLITSIKNLDVDILCMQDIDDRWMLDLELGLKKYNYHRDNNLLVISKYPIVTTKLLNVENAQAQLVHICGKDRHKNNCDIAIANVTVPKGFAKENFDSLFRRLNRINHKDTIITGNFNTNKIPIPDTWETACNEPTWPSWRTSNEPIQLDWSLTRLTNYELIQGAIMRGVYVSDHIPVLLELSHIDK